MRKLALGTQYDPVVEHPRRKNVTLRLRPALQLHSMPCLFWITGVPSYFQIQLLERRNFWKQNSKQNYSWDGGKGKLLLIADFKATIFGFIFYSQ